MPQQSQRIRIPKSALKELEIVEGMDWTTGVGLEELVDWINWVADRFRPESEDESSRTKKDFTPRTFRHYQTLECIDPPERRGRAGFYGFRQYLQALNIRKLLWEGISSTQIQGLMEGKSNDEYKDLLLRGVEIVASPEEEVSPPAITSSPQTWTHISLAPGVELQLSADRPRLARAEIDAAVREMRRRLGA